MYAKNKCMGKKSEGNIATMSGALVRKQNGKKCTERKKGLIKLYDKAASD